MIRKLPISILVLTGCLALAAPTIAQTCADIHGASGCAPSPMDGAAVSLTGIVYVVNGTYNSGSIYFHCGSGGNGGMTFFDSAVVVADGDEITVTGTVGAFGDEIQLTGTAVTVNSSGNAYTAEVIGTGDLAAGTPNLGGLMEVTGMLALVSEGFNSIYTVDDGTGPVLMFLDGSTGIDPVVVNGWLGDIVTVRGATKCFDGQGELLPRSIEDIVLDSVPVDVQNFGSVKSIYR